MIWPLLKFDLKRNYSLFIIIAAVMVFYLEAITSMYEPSSLASLNDVFGMLPPEMVSAMGFGEISGQNLVSFLASLYYGLLIFVFPMIYYLILANRLVAKMVDSGSLAYILQTPYARWRIILTQGLYLLISLAVLFLVVWGAGWLVGSSMFPGMMDSGAWWHLNLSAYLLTALMAMICFFYGCYFNEAKQAMGISAAICIGSLVLMMLGGVSEQSAFLQDWSIYSLLDGMTIVNNGNTLALNLTFSVMIMALFGASIWLFRGRRLSL